MIVAKSSDDTGIDKETGPIDLIAARFNLATGLFDPLNGSLVQIDATLIVHWSVECILAHGIANTTHQLLAAIDHTLEDFVVDGLGQEETTQCGTTLTLNYDS